MIEKKDWCTIIFEVKIEASFRTFRPNVLEICFISPLKKINELHSLIVFYLCHSLYFIRLIFAER